MKVPARTGILALGSLVLGLAGSASAAQLSGSIRWKLPPEKARDDVLRASTVIYLTGFDEPAESKVVTMNQKDKTFLPDALAIQVGQSVAFGNRDPHQHNVFSTSVAASFDLGITPPEDAPTVRFARSGLVDVYCNIHPEMVGSVLVLPNRAYAVLPPGGKSYRIPAIPPGDWTVHLWNRFAKPQHQRVKFRESETRVLSWDVALENVSTDHLDKTGRPYRERKGYPVRPK